MLPRTATNPRRKLKRIMPLASVQPRRITSRQNSAVKEFRALLSHAGRSTPAQVAIESENLVREALRSGLRLQSVMVSETAEHVLNSLPVPPGCELFLVPDAVFDSIAATRDSQGVAALVTPPQFSVEDILRQSDPLILIAAGIQDPGNFGTLVRSAEAFAAAGVLGLPGTVSIWNQKALRASAGSAFRIPVLGSAISQLRDLKQLGIRLLATSSHSTTDAGEVNLRRGCALLLGSEGSGLGSEVLAVADEVISIRCPGPVESLNAAVAGSLLLYEASRQRSRRSNQ